MPELVGKVARRRDIDAEVQRMRNFIWKCGCSLASQPSFRDDGKEISVLIGYECPEEGKAMLVKMAFPLWQAPD